MLVVSVVFGLGLRGHGEQVRGCVRIVIDHLELGIEAGSREQVKHLMIKVLKLSVGNLIEQIAPLVFFVRVCGEIAPPLHLLSYTNGSMMRLLAKTVIFLLI